MGELYVSTATGGSTTTLIDASLDQYWPSNVGQQSSPWAIWCYGSATALGTTNRTAERRAKSYAQNTHTVTFLSTWPEAITGGAYEFHWRTPRSRKLEAINSGVRQLGCHWARSLIDTSLTTAANTWAYALPAAVPWHNIPQVELQLGLDATLIGYPYASSGVYNWSIREATNASGVTSYTLQFGSLPPPGKTIRIFADAGYVDLVADADILPLDVNTAGMATEWLYAWAMYQLQRWESVRQPMNNTDWLEKQAAALLKEAVDIRDRFGRVPTQVKITTPGHGDGQGGVGGNDPAYLAAFRSGWI